MSREVFLTHRAVADIDAALEFYNGRSGTLAERWVAACDRVIDALEDHPERYPLAREAKHLQIDLRQHNFGVGRRLSHRALYRFRDERVVVYAVRHLAQQDVQFEDLL